MALLPSEEMNFLMQNQVLLWFAFVTLFCDNFVRDWSLYLDKKTEKANTNTFLYHYLICMITTYLSPDWNAFN